MRRSAEEVGANNDRLPARTDPRSSIVGCSTKDGPKMMFRSRIAQITILAAGSAFALITATAVDSAHGEGNLDASYTISFARIPVGEITATAVFGESEYAMSARARAGGVLKALLVDGEASFSTQGTIKGGHPVPTTFTSKIVSNTETSDVTMVLDEGNVKELAATPLPSSDRVPVTNFNRQSIVDPLTAMLFSAAAAGEGLSPEACRHTLPIFDGRQRYDLKLAFKRMDKVTAEKGYAGPVVVCSVSYEPIAGHRANIPLVKYLSEGREMEIALAPMAGTRLLAPFRLSVVSTLANLTIEANQFEAIMAPAPAGAPANVAHPSNISPTRRDGGDERCVEVRSGVVVCQKVPEPAPK
jgi:Protein of unknown function (DUF3108)